jgi:hypothetical protein
MMSALVRMVSSMVVMPAAVFVLASCQSSTGPSLPRGVDIRPTSDVFPIEVVNGRKRVTVTTVIRNDSDRAIYYVVCSEGVSRRDAGGVWKQVWRPVCPLALFPPEAIEAGSSKFLVVQVDDDNPDFPALRFPFEDLSARYRIDVGLLVRSRSPDTDKFLPIDGSQSVSDAFSVVQ